MKKYDINHIRINVYAVEKRGMISRFFLPFKKRNLIEEYNEKNFELDIKPEIEKYLDYLNNNQTEYAYEKADSILAKILSGKINLIGSKIRCVEGEMIAKGKNKFRRHLLICNTKI